MARREECQGVSGRPSVSYIFMIYLRQIVSSAILLVPLVTDCQEDSSFLVAGQKIDYPAHRRAANELQ